MREWLGKINHATEKIFKIPKSINHISLGLRAIFLETSAPWEPSGGRSKCTGWIEQKEKWGKGPSKPIACAPWEPQELHTEIQKGRGLCWCANCRTDCLLSRTCLSGSRTLITTWLQCLPLRAPHCSHQNSPFWSFYLDLWHSGLVLFSIVAECNM